MARRDRLFGKYTRSKDATNRTNIYNEYKDLRNRIIDLIRVSKQDYFNSYFQTNSKNIRNLWKGINQIVNSKTKTYDSPTSLIGQDNQLKTEPQDISNEFNNFFSNIAQDILDKRTYEGDGNFEQYLHDQNANAFTFDPVDEEEITSIISKFGVNKASGPTSVPTDILKYLKHEIAKPLTLLINLSITQGIHPDMLKIAKVIPIYKKGSKLNACNFRPISLLSNINKIYEKSMHTRTYSFLDRYNCLYDLQFGFRSRHSTEQALIHILGTIRKTLDSTASQERKFACGVFC